VGIASFDDILIKLLRGWRTCSAHADPIEAEQSDLNGFLPDFYWPDYVSNLSTLW